MRETKYYNMRCRLYNKSQNENGVFYLKYLFEIETDIMKMGFISAKLHCESKIHV